MDTLARALQEFSKSPVEVLGALAGIVAAASAAFKTGRRFWRNLWARLRSKPYDPRLASAMLRMDAEELLKRYKEMDFDHREAVRIPLNNSSWPSFGQPWDYVHFSLCSNARMMTIFILKAQAFWSQMKYKTNLKVFALNQQSRLDQVIEALEEFQKKTEGLA